jgi:magnesium chelatase family protein
MCTPRARRQYYARLSGPLLDRVDLRVQMRPLLAMNPNGVESPENTETVRARVGRARQRAEQRWSAQGWRTNAEVPGPTLRRQYRLPARVTASLDRGLATGSITARGADRCLRVAWTLADLADLERPGLDQVAAALNFRERSVA